MLTLVLLALIAVAFASVNRMLSGPLPLYCAMVHGRFRTGLHGSTDTVRSAAVANVLAMARPRLPDDRPPARPIRNPFASSDPLAKHRAITGINAHVRWYQRIGSVAGIVVLVALMGILVAVSVGLAFVAARIVLDILIG